MATDKFTLIAEDTSATATFVGVNDKKPRPGDEWLIIERPLRDPATNQQRGTLTACVTFVKILPGPVYLFLGNANHHLSTNRLNVQGSWRSEEPTPVYAIAGGNGKYMEARGTVTYKRLEGDLTKQQFSDEVLY